MQIRYGRILQIVGRYKSLSLSSIGIFSIYQVHMLDEHTYLNNYKSAYKIVTDKLKQTKNVSIDYF